MKPQRVIPPAAAPLAFFDLFHGMAGLLRGKKYLRELERGLKEYFGVEHIFLVSSGKAALTIILKSLKSLSPEKEKVLVPAYTCFSVPSAIVKAGLRVSACDVNPLTFDFDYHCLKQELDQETCVVVSTHFFGIPADVDRVKNLCRPRGIFVVEDAAQAMGGSSNGKKLGTTGDAGFFSLGRGKNITSGSGGIIVTNNKRIADAIARQYEALKPPGFVEDIKELIKLIAMKIFLHPHLYWVPAGIPSLKLGETIFHRDFPVARMSGMKAGVLRSWKERLLHNNQVRKSAGLFYEKALGRCCREGRSIPYLRFPVLMGSREMRDSVFQATKARGGSLMYPSPINEIEELREGFSGKCFPAAKEISDRLMTLPTHQLAGHEDKHAICKALGNGHA